MSGSVSLETARTAASFVAWHHQFCGMASLWHGIIRNFGKIAAAASHLSSNSLAPGPDTERRHAPRHAPRGPDTATQRRHAPRAPSSPTEHRRAYTAPPRAGQSLARGPDTYPLQLIPVLPNPFSPTPGSHWREARTHLDSGELGQQPRGGRHWSTRAVTREAAAKADRRAVTGGRTPGRAGPTLESCAIAYTTHDCTHN
jgi:hypothetical protein